MTAGSKPPGRILRHIWAIVAGFLAGAVLTTAIDVILHVTGVFPPWDKPIDNALSVLALAYRIPIGVMGSYIMARLAPNRPMQHALIGGVLGLVLCLAGAAVTWDKGLGPHWYPLVLAATTLPCAWLGGRFSLGSPQRTVK